MTDDTTHQAGPTSSVAGAAIPSARPRSRRGEGDRLREEILDATERLIADKGSIDAVSIRAIAKAVGCTPPALYLHFEDKDDLVFCVCQRRFEEFHERLAASTEGIDDPSEAMMAMGRAYVAYGSERPEAYRVLFGMKSESVIPDDVPAEELPGMMAFALLVEKIVEGVGAGQFTADDPVAAAIGIWATMHGLVMLLDGHGGDQGEGRIEIPDTIVDTVCLQALNGLRVR